MRVEAADRMGVTGEAWADLAGYDGAESFLSLHRFNRNEAMFIPSNLRNLRNLRTRFRVWFIRAHLWFYPNPESV
jgi:hypothetical protein